MALGPAVFDRHIPAFDEADFAQTLAERGHPRGVSARRFAVEKPDHRQRRLLRPRCERPHSRHAAYERDELAPPDHSITSSARPRSVIGTVRLSAFAVFMLMISSTFVAW